MEELGNIARLFVNEVSLGRSVDWYLIKLSSVVTRIKDIYGSEASVEVFEKFLKVDVVIKALEPLACYVDVVEERIGKDPRFSGLRPYTDTLVKALRGIQCRDIGLSTLTKEPTFKVEHGVNNKFYEVRVRRARKALIKIRTKDLINVLIVVLAASLIAYIIYVLIHSRWIRPSII